MMRKSLIFTLIACMTIGLAKVSFAWDGKRKGFLLGIGGGVGLISFANESELAFMSDFKLGYAPSNRLAIFWMSKVAWFSSDFRSFSGESALTINGIGGVAIAYYLQPKGIPSPYLTVGYGFSSFGTPFKEGSETLYGNGIAVGAGYEFSKHFSVEGNLTMGTPDKNGFGFGTTAFRITVNVLGY